MSDKVSADTDDLDEFVDHGQTLQPQLQSTYETVARQRSYLLTVGFPRTVESSDISDLDNTLFHMSDLNKFVEDISAALKRWGEDLGQGVFRASSTRIQQRLDDAVDERLDAIEQALIDQGFSDEDASRLRDQVELVLEENPQFELDGATASEPTELAAAIAQNIENRANELIDNNNFTSSTLHAQPSLSVSRLAADIHYGNNDDPLVPDDLLMDALGANLSDDQNNELDDLLEQLGEREQLATFDLLKHATEPPEIDGDFDALAAEAELLFDENLTGPGMYGGAPRLNEPEIAYQLQKISEQDPGRALGLKWMLDGMLNPDQRAELDRALAGEASWSDRVDRGIAHPADGLEGAAKGTWNHTFGWVLDEWADATVGVAVASQQANRRQPPSGNYGYEQPGWLPPSWEEIDAVVEFELEMDNIAQQGGADIAEAIEIASSVYGVGKGGLTLVRVGRNYFLRSRGRIVAAVGGAGTTPFNSRGQLQRQGNRIIFKQAPGSMDCGPTSCAMGLDTLGQQVDDVDAFVRRFNVRDYGMTPPEMVSDLNRMGIRSTARLEMSVDDVARQTRHGAPMIVRVEHPTPGGSGHFVIVDGVTTRFGQQVVAIRDPLGRQYFEAIDVFEARFSGHGLTFEG